MAPGSRKSYPSLSEAGKDKDKETQGGFKVYNSIGSRRLFEGAEGQRPLPERVILERLSTSDITKFKQADFHLEQKMNSGYSIIGSNAQQVSKSP